MAKSNGVKRFIIAGHYWKCQSFFAEVSEQSPEQE
jgi:hypothetical protein